MKTNMSLQKKIAHNTIIQVLGKFAGTVLSLITAGMVLRHLGDDGFGQYTTITSFLQLFGIMMDFGLYIILVKKIADLKDLNHPIVHNIFTLRVLSGVIFLGIAPFLAWVVGQFSDAYNSTIITGVAITTLFFFFISLNQLLSAIFQKVLRADWIALAEFIGKIVLLAATIVVVALGLDVLAIMVTLVLSAGANFLVNFLASRKYVRLKLRFNWTEWKKLLHEAWPIAVSIGFSLMYFKGDTVILTFFEPDEVVGWYGAPYKILEVLVTLPAMFTGLALPVLTAAWQKKDTVRFQDLLQKSFDALAIIALPMVAGMIALSPMVIHLIAGDDFGPSRAVLEILIVGTAAIFFGTLFSYVVVSLGRQRQMMWGYGFVAFTSLIGYFIFIPLYSLHGAAWVTVYSEIMVAVIAYLIVRSASQTSIRLKRFMKSLVASCVMLAALYISFAAYTFAVLPYETSMPKLAYTIIGLAILIPFGAVVYFITLFIIGGITKDDMRLLTRLKKS